MWHIIKSFAPDASSELIRYDPAIANIPIPQEDVTRIFCEEEELAFDAIKYSRAYLEMLKGNEDAVDKLSIFYRQIDDCLEKNNQEGLVDLTTDIKTIIKKHGDFDSYE